MKRRLPIALALFFGAPSMGDPPVCECAAPCPRPHWKDFECSMGNPMVAQLCIESHYDDYLDWYFQCQEAPPAALCGCRDAQWYAFIRAVNDDCCVPIGSAPAAPPIAIIRDHLSHLSHSVP